METKALSKTCDAFVAQRGSSTEILHGNKLQRWTDQIDDGGGGDCGGDEIKGGVFEAAIGRGRGVGREEDVDIGGLKISRASSARDTRTIGSGSTGIVRRWSMASQSIVTQSVSAASLTTSTKASSFNTGGGFDKSTTCATDTEEIELTEEVQQNLQKLGFRKHKGKRKKTEKQEKSKKKSEKRHESTEEEIPKNPNAIDLKQDPVLVKLQKKNRNVGTFHCEPQSQPCAVCFEIKGSSPSHKDVLVELKKLTKLLPEVVIKKLHFNYRALANNSPDIDNRWIITTNSVSSRNRLAGCQLRLMGTEIQLRRYDDVIMAEYQQYRRMVDFMKMMNNRLGVNKDGDKPKGGGDGNHKQSRGGDQQIRGRKSERKNRVRRLISTPLSSQLPSL